MSLLALMFQAGQGDQAESIASTFGVDLPHLGAQVVSFAIVCGLLYLLAYKPVLAMLDARRQQIAQGLANTEKINAALAAIESQRQETLSAARVEATRLIAEARDAAKRLRDLETQRAVAAAEQIVVKARDAAALEHVRMMHDLRGELGRLVVQTTAAVTGKILTADDQRRLTEATAGALKPAADGTRPA
jgi:F-type H+-transporting ATPase subunit b